MRLLADEIGDHPGASRVAPRLHYAEPMPIITSAFAHAVVASLRRTAAVKPLLLYVPRSCLNGHHLMRTGEVEANLVRLNGEFRPAVSRGMIGRQMQGSEDGERTRRPLISTAARSSG